MTTQENRPADPYLDNQLTASFMLGVSDEWERASVAMRKRACDAFAEGNDTEARIYRNLVKEFQKTHDERRAEWKKFVEDMGL